MEVPEPLVPTQPRYTTHLTVASESLDGDTRLDEDTILQNMEEEPLLESGCPDLPEAFLLPSEATDLPPGWIACWAQRFHVFYYVHHGARIKTWKKPIDAIEYTPFPRVASRLGIDNFDPDVSPPLPDEFQVLAWDHTPPAFEYPVSVHLVYSPVRGAQPIYRLMDAVQASFQKIATSIHDHVILGPYLRVYSILFGISLLNCLGWIVVTIVILFPLIWRLMSSLIFLPVIYILAEFCIRRFTQVPKTIMRDMMVAASGTLTLNTLVRIGSDQAAWSHWKVLMGPYMYELVKVPREGPEPESTGQFLNLIDWVEMQATSMPARNLISTISSEEDHPGIELPSDEAETLLHESTLAELQAEFPAIQFAPLPMSRRPALKYSEERSRTTLAVAEITHQERTGIDSGDVCQCIRRHLTEEEYEDLHRKYSMVYIGSTEMSEQERDEKAQSLMKSWPPYRTFDTNCQAFALSFLDALCSSNISAISSRMVLHFAWFVHLPNVLNIVLGIVICCFPTIMGGEKSNLEFFLRINWAFMAFLMAYDYGWKAFTLLLSPRIGLAVDSRIQTYYMHAAGRPSRFSAAARERIVFYLLFVLYTFIHTGLFVSFLYYNTIYYIAVVTMNERLIEATFWFWIEKGLKRTIPCSALGISGTFALTPKSFVYLLKIWLVIVALFFLWPVIVVRIFSNPFDIGFPWIQNIVSNFADLRDFNEKHERLVELALEFNLTSFWNGSVDPWKLVSVVQQSNLTDFIPQAVCVVWGVVNGTNSTPGYDGEL